DGAGKADEPERERLRGKLAPAYFVLLAGVSPGRDESVDLRAVRGRKARPALVLEGADDAERAHGSGLERDPLRLRKLTLRDGDLRAELQRGGARFGSRA